MPGVKGETNRMASDVTVVILAAGLGTRMRSRQAKVLHRAGGLSLIEHAVNSALDIAEPARTFVVVGYQADRVRQTVAGGGVGFIEQIEQKGTGHALLCGERELSRLGGLLVIFYGDCPLILRSTLARLVACQLASNAAATIVTTELPDPTGYGRVIRTADGVAAVVEQKAGTREQLAVREINAGIYCFQADLFWKHIGEIQPNKAANEYYLTDMIEILIRAGHRIDAMKVSDSGELLGINNRVELATVDRIFRERKIRQLMLDGVTVEKPETVTVDSGVTVGMDTVIEPFAQLLGKTTVGEDCHIGACSIVRDSDLADGVTVSPFTVIGTSRLESGVTVGPFARLRMGNHLAKNAHIGNFVELKKARIGAGTKAGHLAYLGDCDLGESVNVGAGTITCNYDGVHKHGTKIGDGVFVGSNSTLVAPIEIGAGAYLAAGSVITENVPEKALALGRARQVIKEGWKKKGQAAKRDLPPAP